MSWVLAIGLALAAMLAFAFLFRVPRSGWASLAAALVVGLAGYTLQASPGLPGAPKASVAQGSRDGSDLVETRKRFGGANPPGDFLIIADGLTRQGQFANAAGILRGAVRRNPDDAEAWLAMANALVAHTDGLLTPPALYAYGKALEADKNYAAPAFFLGIVRLREGRLTEARELWGEALHRTPEGAPWRADLEQQLAALDAVMHEQNRP